MRVCSERSQLAANSADKLQFNLEHRGKTLPVSKTHILCLVYSANYCIYDLLASEPAFGGLTCYSESCAIKSGPAAFEASSNSLVATEGSCFNDGKFKI